MTLTANDSYFEDFTVGDKFKHRRGRTIEAADNSFFTNTTMNTASPHFDKFEMEGYMGGRFPERLVNGGFTISLVMGLTNFDVAENAIQDIGYTNIRVLNSAFPGDTIYARSEILAVEESADREDAGLIRYRFEGYNQKDEPLITGERTILVKKRSHWDPMLGYEAV